MSSNLPAFLFQSSLLRFLTCPILKAMERLIRVHSPLVGYESMTSKKRPFRRSLAASWDSKRRSLEEDFARKEHELRSEQVPKTAWKGWWSQNLTDLYHPKKKTKGCSLCLGGLIWP